MIFAILNVFFGILTVGSDKMKQKLFLDLAKNYNNSNILIDSKKYKNVTINHYMVDEVSSKKLKKEEGDFYSVNFTEDILFSKPKIILREVEKILDKILKKYNTKRTLIIGLGNSSITADSLGVKSTNKIIATNHYNDFLTIPKIAIFNPEVTEKTGINSFNLIKLVVNDYKPECIIIIDSLATSNKEYLNRCIEINTTGIIPGSALRDNREINKNTFGIPVLSIGVPLVIQTGKEFFTSLNIEFFTDKLSDLISTSLNNIFLS